MLSSLGCVTNTLTHTPASSSKGGKVNPQFSMTTMMRIVYMFMVSCLVCEKGHTQVEKTHMTLVGILSVKNLAEDLLRRLNVVDLLELSLTCKEIFKLMDDDTLWEGVLWRRHGDVTPIAKVTHPTHPHRQEFLVRSSLHKEAPKWLQGAWVDDPHHWRPVALESGKRIMYLGAVWWLDVGIIFSNVLPGFYKIRWSITGASRRFPFFVQSFRFPLEIVERVVTQETEGVTQSVTQEEVAPDTHEIETQDPEDVESLSSSEDGTPQPRMHIYGLSPDSPTVIQGSYTATRSEETHEFPYVLHLQSQDDILTGLRDTRSTYKSGQGLEWAALIPTDPDPNVCVVTQRQRKPGDTLPVPWALQYRGYTEAMPIQPIRIITFRARHEAARIVLP
eukprot:Blabericola_migrator_1__7848@NODE_400_length_8905_cov_313_446821_g317_i0_p3_GENE_NODE_400_length_8905_cov_313_446821_g317_i0NODE_400_length_8905_cov_313_446821_g317_i0_p3_ORF_typecomplete_len391_score85_48PP2/PF14299_6/0_012Fbox/PF00646_33/0_04_NODE_400_length_8905_cov_313_446821_g317_i068608032